ncbi:MAG: insulinase family protein [Myxococcales bacterium]|nr:insulinase family protein [Myxococcales bacterium]
MKLARLVLALTASLVVLGHAPLPARAEASALPAPPEIRFEKYQLDNGLEVILHRDSSLPLVAVNLWYHVGPANEPKGRSGFAHLFEHLMFEGSKHVGHRFDALLEAAGATNVNGTTSWDRTNYFETVPARYLELALWIESDRMGFLLDSLTKERLDVQRGVVKNERRQSYENAPYGKSSLALLDGLYPEGHPYHGAVIGSMKDLDAASMDDVRAFYTAFYAPSNATLTLAGDFEPKRARELIQKYFGPLRKRDKPAAGARTPTPPLAAARHVEVPETVELAKVAFGYITPPAYSKDDAALDVTAAILAGGKATRLYRELVVKKRIASDVDASLDSNQLASTFEVSAMVAGKHDAKELEAGLSSVLEELGKSGPTPAELSRAKRRLLVDLYDNLQLLNGPGGESGRAGLLQRFNHYLGDPGGLPRYVRALENVSAADVARVVQTHLGAGHRLVVTTVPTKEKP